MAAVSDSVWAIDLGNNSLKALHLAVVNGVAQVIGFDNIGHGKILSGSGVKAGERDELIALSLRKFVQRNELGNDEVVISVPSQNSFARFVNLPPVESKRIGEIIKFEAVQQIPFDINDVQWDWQLMTKEDSPEKKVGIFAIKNEVVNSALEHFGREDVQVGYVQMAPMALYNYAFYDRSDLLKSDNQGIVVLDIGAENTDLVVCTKSTVWQRCILIGGNAFTKAIADTFKLEFEKAERLKRTAPVSKYARQILQAMKPVFTDLASEVQRSLGFYTSSNPNTKFSKVIALGGGTKLRGLLKYLQQTLQIPVERPDSFKRLAIGPSVSAAKFHENVCDFGVVYGLALQGMGLGRIESNLLPRSVARSMAWASKGKYFTAAACMLLAVSLMGLGRTTLDKINYAKNGQVRQNISHVLGVVKEANDKLAEEQRKGSGYEATIKKEFELFKYREVVPLLQETILSALPNAQNDPDQKELYEAFANGDVETVLKTPRNERKQLFVTIMSVYYAGDLAKASFGGTAMMRRGDRIRTTELEGAEGYGDEYYMMEEYRMIGEMGMEGSPYAPPFALGGQTAQAEKKAGFVVTVAGYSPYKNIGELLDPIGAEKTPSRWGFVTRLAHLNDIVDGNSPFELYKKTDPNHFKLPTGPVGLDEQMPAGIGVVDVTYEKTEAVGGIGPMTTIGTGKQFLIDPMTKEEIGKVAKLDEFGKAVFDRDNKPVYVMNDHWFVLNVKFVWKDAPIPPEAPMPTLPGSSYRMPVRPVPSSGAAPSGGTTKSSRRRSPGLPMDFE
jgi:type IV pilus assembly protein PilM